MISMKAVIFIGCTFLFIFTGVEFLYILHLNNGTFTYSLDDPYIHLALAEQIAQGHYGINEQEFSSPASSIIWPLLLSLFTDSDFFVYSPLAINFLITLTMYCVIVLILKQATPLNRTSSMTIFGLTLTLAFNALGLAFNGMEHNLHMLCSLLILFGLIKTEQAAQPPYWIYAVIVLNPLVRPEGLALSFLSLLYLLWYRKLIYSLLFGALIIGLLASYGYFLYSLGLDTIPSSISVKSAEIKVDQTVSSRWDVIYSNIVHPGGLLVFLGTLPLLVTALERKNPLWKLAALIGLCGVAHITFGRMGWFARYEAYLVALIYLAIIVIYWQRLTSFWNHRVWLQRPLLVFCTVIIMAPYINCTLITPLAAHNIYQQHFQMQRFIKEFYPYNVAVNDIGYVSLHNPNYVLDLFGLSYAKAFKLRKENDSPAWMEPLVQEKNVKLAMLHDRWFAKVPASWHKLGTLDFEGPRITPVGRKVSFYSTQVNQTIELRSQLLKFQATLPQGVSFNLQEAKP